MLISKLYSYVEAAPYPNREPLLLLPYITLTPYRQVDFHRLMFFNLTCLTTDQPGSTGVR